MIELLSGPLVGGAVVDKLGSKNWGNLMIALDPSIMGSPATIAHNVQLMLERVKGAKKASGVSEIMLPGERGNRLAGTDVFSASMMGLGVQSRSLLGDSHGVLQWHALCVHVGVAFVTSESMLPISTRLEGHQALEDILTFST